MKSRICILTMVLILFLLVFCAGCQSDQAVLTEPPTEIPTEAPTTALAEIDVVDNIGYTGYTDLELLRLACGSGCLDEWGLSSDSRDYSLLGLVKISESCPPLRELLSRSSAVESVRLYVPDLIEEYTESGEHGLVTFALTDILYKILCPDLLDGYMGSCIE